MRAGILQADIKISDLDMDRLLGLKRNIMTKIELHQRAIEALQNQIKGIEAVMKTIGDKPLADA